MIGLRFSQDWNRIKRGLCHNWARIGPGLGQNWSGLVMIGPGLGQDWARIGLRLS